MSTTLTIAALLGLIGGLAQPAAALTTRADNSSCTFTGTEGYLKLSQTKNDCTTIILDSLQVPGNVTLDLENLNDGTTVIFEGHTTWGYAPWAGSLLSVSGSNLTVRGAPGAVLDGQGALWWDGVGNGGGTIKTKPKFFKANYLNDSLLEGIYILNAPINSFSINYVNNLTLRDITVNNTAGEVLAANNETLGHNTDAFDINNADGVVITGAKVWNQDDCVAVNSGQNVLFKDGFCSGGHGLSIGSVGGRDNNDVKNITFEDVVMERSQQSVRIKTIADANGTVSDITYRNIQISQGTEYGIIVTQSYNGEEGQPTNGVPITNFVLQDITGTVESEALNVYIECGEGSCSDWTWTDVNVTGGKNASSTCMNVPDGIWC